MIGRIRNRKGKEMNLLGHGLGPVLTWIGLDCK